MQSGQVRRDFKNAKSFFILFYFRLQATFILFTGINHILLFVFVRIITYLFGLLHIYLSIA